MHAVKGLNTAKHTFVLTIQVGGVSALALLDSGSTATFMTPQFAQQAQCALTAKKKLKVMVANGDILWTEFTAIHCPYTVQGAQLHSDFRILNLKGYDIILGTVWIYHHSPMVLDGKKMEITVTTDNGTKTFIDDSLPITASLIEVEELHHIWEDILWSYP